MFCPQEGVQTDVRANVEKPFPFLHRSDPCHGIRFFAVDRLHTPLAVPVGQVKLDAVHFGVRLNAFVLFQVHDLSIQLIIPFNKQVAPYPSANPATNRRNTFRHSSMIPSFRSSSTYRGEPPRLRSSSHSAAS